MQLPTQAEEEALDRANVSRETRHSLNELVGELERWQRAKNLVSQGTMPHVWTRHVLDSWQLLEYAPPKGEWVDLGSGAGFPGLVVAVSRTQAGAGTTHLIESNGRKCAFLRHIGHRLKLDMQVHEGRLEDYLRSWPRVPAVISARALAPLDKLLAWCEHLLRSGALGIFPKGQDVEGELAYASTSWMFDAQLKPSMTDAAGKILLVRMDAQGRAKT